MTEAPLKQSDVEKQHHLLGKCTKLTKSHEHPSSRTHVHFSLFLL